MARILHIDDDEQLRSLLRAVLQVQDHEVVSASDGREGLARFGEQPFDLVLCDIQMPVMDGMQVLEAIMNDRVDTPVVMATSVDEIKTALTALKMGAFDYVLKPFKLPILVQTIQRALAVDAAHSGRIPSEGALSEYYAFPDTIAVSEGMRSACDMVRRVAPFQTPHLITGETGTGRKLLAQSIHKLSGRRDGPFIRCACKQLASGQSEQPFLAANPVTTGGQKQEPTGMLMEACHGTLLLEDVEALPLAYQDHLLRVIHDGVVRPDGGPAVPCDVRILATTRTDLHARVEHGTMREEFVFLLTFMPIVTTPLRARIDDILPLAWHFLLRIAGGRDAVPRIAHGARSALEHYAWPGNAGELLATVQNAFEQCRTGKIEMGDFPAQIINSLEGFELGRESLDDEGQRGEAFRAHLAEKLADQLQSVAPPPPTTVRRERSRHQPRRKEPELWRPKEEDAGAYVPPRNATPTAPGGQRPLESPPAAPQRTPAPKPTVLAPPPPPPPVSVEDKQHTGKRRSFGARLRAAFRILLGKD